MLGVYAYWGPKAGCAILQLESSTADISFGAVTVLTGIAGTMGGGLLLDIMGSTLPTTLGLCSMAVVVGGTIIALTFAFVRSVGLFFALFAVGELALFCIQVCLGGGVFWGVFDWEGVWLEGVLGGVLGGVGDVCVHECNVFC